MIYLIDIFKLKGSILKMPNDTTREIYCGDLFEVIFSSENSETTDRIRSIFHDAFVGNPDYINSNVLVFDDKVGVNNQARLGVCLEDIKHKKQLKCALHEIIDKIF